MMDNMTDPAETDTPRIYIIQVTLLANGGVVHGCSIRVLVLIVFVVSAEVFACFSIASLINRSLIPIQRNVHI